VSSQARPEHACHAYAAAASTAGRSLCALVTTRVPVPVSRMCMCVCVCAAGQAAAAADEVQTGLRRRVHPSRLKHMPACAQAARRPQPTRTHAARAATGTWGGVQLRFTGRAEQRLSAPQRTPRPHVHTANESSTRHAVTLQPNVARCKSLS
jgi:hypothetical protein